MNTKQKFMKQFKFYMPLVLTALFIGCSSDDKLVDKVGDGIQRGAILRTISIAPNSFLFNDPDSPWTAILEYQDVEDGALLESVDVTVSLVDLTVDNGSTTIPAAGLATISASEFSTGEFGLPRTTFSVTYNVALSALGLTIDAVDVAPGDQIQFDFSLNLTDGRTITGGDLSGTVSGGSFFSSPLTYRANIVCPPRSSDEPGTWQIEMQDSYGDGWNGASLEVTIDGDTQSYSIAEGSEASFSFNLPASAEILSIIYRPGAFDNENTFQVISPGGNVLLDLGPSPVAEIELIDYCIDF